jgi:hypothetical protein
MQAALATSNGTDEVVSVAAGLIQSLWGSLPNSAGLQASGLAALLMYTGNPDPKAHPAVRLESGRLVCISPDLQQCLMFRRTEQYHVISSWHHHVILLLLSIILHCS